MNRYRADPRWIESKYAGTDQNGRAYRKGERVWFYPRTKVVIAGEAAQKAAAEFAADAQDEEALR